MDLDTISPAAFGASLRGLGINLMVRDVTASAAFLGAVFGMAVHRLSADFAIVTYGDASFQLHADATFANHPLLGLVPETPPRGGGIELRLYDSDPDGACAAASAAGHVVLQPATNKPHGLREACILDPDGYAWVPSRPLMTGETA